MARHKKQQMDDVIKARAKLDFERAKKLIDAQEIPVTDVTFTIQTSRPRADAHEELLKLAAAYCEGTDKQMRLDDSDGRVRRKAAWEKLATHAAELFKLAWGFTIDIPYPSELADALAIEVHDGKNPEPPAKEEEPAKTVRKRRQSEVHEGSNIPTPGTVWRHMDDDSGIVHEIIVAGRDYVETRAFTLETGDGIGGTQKFPFTAFKAGFMPVQRAAKDAA